MNKELNRDTPCEVCGKVIPYGTYLSELEWVKPLKRWYHQTCVIVYPNGVVCERRTGKKMYVPPNLPPDVLFRETATPPAPGKSTGERAGANGSGPAPASGQSVQTVPDHAEQRGTPGGFVYVGFWVPPDQVDRMLTAFKEARKP